MILRIVITLVILAGIGLASRWPSGVRERAAAELRLSWRMRPEAERVCRIRTPEELANLPAHMREEEVCERRVPPHHLSVRVDDQVLVDRMVEAAGARSDRPLAVFGRFTLAPGTRIVRVVMTREGPAPSREHPRGETPTHALPAPAALELVLDTTLTFEAGTVRVVTLDEQGQRLRLSSP